MGDDDFDWPQPCGGQLSEDGDFYGTECQDKQGHDGPHWAVIKAGIGTIRYEDMRPTRMTWQYVE